MSEGILLASQSPRRRALIGLLGLPVRVTSANIDETPLTGERPEDYVLRLAEAKARAANSAHPQFAEEGEGFFPRWIVAADTTVVADGEILGKPADAAEAKAMLRRLRGRPHLVLTGLAVLDSTTGKLHRALVRTTVYMRNLTDAEIAAYVATGDPLDKAGAYAIQNPAFAPVARIEGCYTNVIGLPLCATACLLRAAGASPAEKLGQRCSEELDYPCECDYPKCRRVKEFLR